jgi:hypothetical protein
MRVFHRRLRLRMRHNGAGLLGVDGNGGRRLRHCCRAQIPLSRLFDGLARFAQPILFYLQTYFFVLFCFVSDHFGHITVNLSDCSSAPIHFGKLLQYTRTCTMMWATSH